jgi:hypothetical protein
MFAVTGTQFWQSFTMNMMKDVVSQIGVNLAFGNSVGFGNLAAGITGAYIGAKIGNWSGVEGGWVKNAVGELAFSAIKGAATGIVSGGTNALIEGKNTVEGMRIGMKNGAIGGAEQSLFMIAAFGTTYKPTDEQLEYVKKMAEASGVSYKDIAWRKGGIYQGVMSLLKNPREVTWGRNIVTFGNDTKPDAFGHEFGHYIQVMQQSWGTMQMKGIWEQLFFKGDPYTIPGTNEFNAELMLQQMDGCANRDWYDKCNCLY